jgi:hypothetical protein
MNSTYYSSKEMVFEKGLLDDCLDATYIIHLEGNGRLDHINQQLELYHPTKTVFIVFNKGYKKTDKKLSKNTPTYDLIDAFINVFKDAEERKYGNILILEDDFIFSEKIQNAKYTGSISKFIHFRNQKRESFLYVLGCLPWFQIPTTTLFDFSTRKVLVRTGTHACIYSKELREKVLAFDQSFISDWDVYTNLYFTNYMFYEPLCYQLFPETENKKYWLYLFGISELLKGLLKYFEMDKKAEPGFSFFYWFSLLFFVFFVLFLLFLGLFFLKKVGVGKIII